MVAKKDEPVINHSHLLSIHRIQIVVPYHPTQGRFYTGFLKIRLILYSAKSDLVLGGSPAILQILGLF